MDEDTSIDACFDYFRRKESVVDVQWAKEQVYRSSCVPEKCPPTRSLVDILSRHHDDDSEECEDGEIGVIIEKAKFRFN